MIWEQQQQQKWTGQEQALGLLQGIEYIVSKMAASALCVKFENKAWRAEFNKTKTPKTKTNQSTVSMPNHLLPSLLLSTSRNKSPADHSLTKSSKKPPKPP
jgi:hypothetical protein